MNIADDLVSAFNDGYEKGKADAEAYLLHCGDETPITNADKIRSMSDEELAEWIHSQFVFSNSYLPSKWWLDWLKAEVTG